MKQRRLLTLGLCTLLSLLPMQLNADIYIAPAIPQGNTPWKPKGSEIVEYIEENRTTKYRIINLFTSKDDREIDAVEIWRISTPARDSTSLYTKAGTIYSASRGCPLLSDPKENLYSGEEELEFFKETPEGNSEPATIFDKFKWLFFQGIYDIAHPQQINPEDNKQNPTKSKGIMI